MLTNVRSWTPMYKVELPQVPIYEMKYALNHSHAYVVRCICVCKMKMK